MSYFVLLSIDFYLFLLFGGEWSEMCAEGESSDKMARKTLFLCFLGGKWETKWHFFSVWTDGKR